MPPGVMSVVRCGRAARFAYRSTPSTLPTPSQVRERSMRSKHARLITTPRVPTSASWHAWTSCSTDSPAQRSRTATARRAAVAASAPGPRPTPGPTNTPRAVLWTVARSPDSASPGSARVATPQSIRARGATTASGQPAPFLHGYRGAPAHGRGHLELVHQAPCPRQAQPQPSRRRVPVLHRAPHVDDARSLIARDHDDPLPVAVLNHAQDNLTALGVHQDVARDLGDGSGDHRLVAAREARFGRQLPSVLTCLDDVNVRCDRQAPLVTHGRGGFPAGDGPRSAPHPAG